MTNQATSSEASAAIEVAVRKVGPSVCVVIGGEQIDTYLRENPRLRALVPRVYGLGDLSEVLDTRAYAQAESILSSMKESLSKFVVTAPYSKSIDALNTHGFVLLLGPPAAGKSMIAASLSIAAADRWHLPSIRADTASLFRTHWNQDRRQMFWIDDAFGTTQYLLNLADDWNRALPYLNAAIASGTRVVMTSRDYIWRAAAQDLKLSEFEPLEASQVIVDVEDLTDSDKQQILYNHLKFGDQDKEFKTQVKPHLLQASRVNPFLPEVARRFGSKRFTADLSVNRHSVAAFFQNPREHLVEVIRQLTADGRAALALIYLAGGELHRPVERTPERDRALEAIGSTLAGAINSLNELRGSLVSLQASEDERAGERWEFQHPTIGEAFRTILEDDPQLVGLYLGGMSPFSLLGQTSCGDRGIEGALVVGKDDWPIVMRRLEEFDDSYGNSRREAYLAQRTSCDFLGLYLVSQPRIASVGGGDVSPRLAMKLQECGLLPEERRTEICSIYETALVERLDGTALSDAGAQLFNPDEFEHLLGRAKDELLGQFDSALGELSESYDDSEDPSDWLSDAEQTLSLLKEYFVERADEEALELIDDAIVELAGLEQDLRQYYAPEPDFDDDRDDFRGWDSTGAADIFADVDA